MFPHVVHIAYCYSRERDVPDCRRRRRQRYYDGHFVEFNEKVADEIGRTAHRPKERHSPERPGIFLADIFIYLFIYGNGLKPNCMPFMRVLKVLGKNSSVLQNRAVFYRTKQCSIEYANCVMKNTLRIMVYTKCIMQDARCEMQYAKSNLCQ